MTNTLPAPTERVLHWLDDHRGIYIPRDFAQSFNADFRSAHIEGVTPEDWAILENGPGGMLDTDHDPAKGQHYWETWEDVCEKAKLFLDRTGRPDSAHYWRIHNDGSCFLVRNDVEWCDECDGWKDADCGRPHDTDEDDNADY